jgi:hypothetical protein
MGTVDDDSLAVLAYVALLRTDAGAAVELDVGLGEGLGEEVVGVGVGDGDPDLVSENESV